VALVLLDEPSLAILMPLAVLPIAHKPLPFKILSTLMASRLAQFEDIMNKVNERYDYFPFFSNLKISALDHH
jgi:hypothetical protein